MSAVQNVAHSPMVELPIFYGEITKYAAFKKSFEYLIMQVSGPNTLWSTHLASCLRGNAKEYVGDPTQWFDKYDELWETLDNKYANRWVLATDTIRTFLQKPPPESELDEVKKYFFSQLQALNNVVALSMSVEEIGVNFVIESLPDEYRTELRNGLRALQPGKKTAAFSKNTVKEVFNDTIGVRKDTQNNSTLKGTLNLQAQTHQHQTTGNNQVGGYSDPIAWCSLCYNEDSMPHNSHQCPHYTTPQAKRDVLVATERCPDCARPVHSGFLCPEHIYCHFHPGERHYTWLCDGHTARDITS